jgi:putative ABC transport system permease protein
MVSRNFVQRFGLDTGDDLTLATPEGELTLRIVGVVNDLAAPNGTVFIDRALYKRVWKDPLLTAFAVQVAPNVTPDELRIRIDERLGASKGILAVTTAGVRQQLREVLDESFAYTRAIELAALLVGLLGLLNTGVVSVLGRTRELGMLRAVGMTRRQLGAMVLTESLLQGLFGGVVAAAVGAGVSLFWLVHELTRTLGWVLDVEVPWPSLGWTVVAGVLVGCLAGFVAARRAMGTSLREALSEA